MTEIFHLPYLAFFLIVGLGFLLGKINFKGLSLDVSAVLFVALLFGHWGVVIPRDFEYVGLLLFIFTIGIQAGPGFFRSFRHQGSRLILLAFVLILSGMVLSLVCASLFRLDPATTIGLFTGSFTSTPGLAAAIDATKSDSVSIGYGIAYPVGVIGVVLFVRIFPKLISQTPRQAEEKIMREIQTDFPLILAGNFRVEKSEVDGKALAAINIRSMTGASISRVMKNREAFTPDAKTVLEKGDLVRAVGSKESLEKVKALIGPACDTDIPLGKEYEVKSLLVTNKKVVNKTLGQLNLFQNYGATVTRVRRSGIDISPANILSVRFGDKLMIACNKDQMTSLAVLLGNDGKSLSNTNFFPIALGIILGVLLGQLRIPLGSFRFSLGITGGVLLSALLLGHFGKTGPLVWTMSGNANQLIRQMGLLFFLSSVGTRAGTQMAGVLSEDGLRLILASLVLTFLPLLIAGFFGYFLLRMNLLRLLGGLTGGMTSTPGLAAAESLSETSAAQEAYAAGYPVAMVLMILSVQVLALLLP